MSDVAAGFVKIIQESLQFNQPTSEASVSAIGALANGLREVFLPVGSIVYSMLNEATFQAQGSYSSSTRWILADGRSVVGSQYQALTTHTNVPDLRGIFVRGKNNGRSDGNQNPDGDLALGTFTTDKFFGHAHAIPNPAHSHTISDPGHQHDVETVASGPSNGGKIAGGNNTGSSTSGNNNIHTAVTGITATNAATTGIVTTFPFGDNETAPKDVTCNAFIRIN